MFVCFFVRGSIDQSERRIQSKKKKSTVVIWHVFFMRGYTFACLCLSFVYSVFCSGKVNIRWPGEMAALSHGCNVSTMRTDKHTHKHVDHRRQNIAHTTQTAEILCPLRMCRSNATPSLLLAAVVVIPMHLYLFARRKNRI